MIKIKLNCLSLLLLACLLTYIVADEVNSCKQLVEEWIQDPQKLPPIVFANSGKFLNDLGDYNNCVHNEENFVYITMSVFNRIVMNNQFMGLCAPVKCRQYLVANSDTQNLQNSLNQAYQKSTNTTFVPFVGMKLYDPEDVHPQMDWSNYLTIGLLSVLVLFGIVGSLLSKVAPQSKALPIKVLKSFSFYDNFMKIILIPKAVDNDNLLFLNGMRVVSIFWIVFGHDMWFRFMNIKNWMDSINILTDPGISTLAPAAYFAVDVFFWIGGFLVTMGMLEQMKKRIKFIPFYLGCILHRFIRIWPTYMVAILMFWKIAPFFGSGPIWRTFYDISCECNNGGVVWNMFFVDNFGDHGPNGRNYCYGWGWYLAVDFQLFLITPFLLFAYKKSKKLGWLLTFTLFMGAVITAFVMIYVNEWRYPIISPKLKPQPNFMDDFYYKPYVRSSAYFMGIFSGFIYYEWKNGNQTVVHIIDKIKKSIMLRTLFYILGIGLTQFIIWIIVPFQQGEVWSNLRQALYNSLNRVIFLLGIYLLVFASMFGCKNDPVKFILGHSFFSPLAKVSFCIYLTHFIVIMNGTFSSRTGLYWQTISSLYHIVTDIVYSVFLALVLSLLVESPTLGLEKIFLRGGEGKKKPQQISKKDIQSLEKSYIEIQDGQEIKQRLMKDFEAVSDQTSTSQPVKRNVESLL